MSIRKSIWIDALFDEVLETFGKRLNPPRKAGYYWVSEDGTRLEIWHWNGIGDDGRGSWATVGWDAPVYTDPAYVDERRILAPDEEGQGLAW